MVFKTEILDINAFKEMVRALQVVNEESTVAFGEEGLSSEVMDNDHTVEFLWKLNKHVMNRYDYGDGDTKITINWTQLLKFIDGFNKDDTLLLELDESANRLLIKGRVSTEGKTGRLKSFSMPLLDPVEDEVPTPKIFFKAKVRMLSHDIVEAMKDAELVGELASFKIEETGISVDASGDMGSASNVWEKGADSLLDLKLEETSRASFMIAKLKLIAMQGAKCSDAMSLELSSDMPMKMVFDTKHGELIYYLAPVMDRD
jgi:proliferating cell nuclear antigen PCNA